MMRCAAAGMSAAVLIKENRTEFLYIYIAFLCMKVYTDMVRQR